LVQVLAPEALAMAQHYDVASCTNLANSMQ